MKRAELEELQKIEKEIMQELEEEKRKYAWNLEDHEEEKFWHDVQFDTSTYAEFLDTFVIDKKVAIIPCALMYNGNRYITEEGTWEELED